MQSLWSLIKQYRTVIVFVFLEIICFSLVVSNNRYQNATFFNSANEYTGSLLSFATSISDYFHLKEQNAVLATENIDLRRQLTKLQQSKGLIMPKPVQDSAIIGQYNYILAKVVSNSTHRANNYITINRGSKHGIRAGMGVISPTGIVGRVKSCNEHFSLVLSLLHKGMRVSAQLKKNQELASVKWDARSPQLAKLLDLPNYVEVAVGDTVLTSGYNATFPPYAHIGVVKSVKARADETAHDIDIQLSTNFNNLAYVYVIENKLKPKQDTLKQEVIETNE